MRSASCGYQHRRNAVVVRREAIPHAFYCVRGMDPTQCMLAERPETVRRARTEAQTAPTTAVAIDYGF